MTTPSGILAPPDPRNACVEGSIADPSAAEQAPPTVPLNTKLHVQLLRAGTVRPSSYASAMSALEKLRGRRTG